MKQLREFYVDFRRLIEETTILDCDAMAFSSMITLSESFTWLSNIPLIPSNGPSFISTISPFVNDGGSSITNPSLTLDLIESMSNSSTGAGLFPKLTTELTPMEYFTNLNLVSASNRTNI